jgi:hypothetical protein
MPTSDGKVVLAKPEDWDRWIEHLQAEVDDEIWAIIDPDVLDDEHLVWEKPTNGRAEAIQRKPEVLYRRPQRMASPTKVEQQYTEALKRSRWQSSTSGLTIRNG